jgi:hypothetical protein
LDRASIGQEGHHNHDEIHRFAQALAHGSSSGAERFFARFAAIALPVPIMDDDVALSHLASCRTHRMRAKCFRRVHWLWCTVLHKHILPETRDFFNSPPLHRLVGSNRPYAEELAQCLRRHRIRVFYDSFEQASLWGKDLYTHLHTIYSEKAQYCVIFISSSYITKMWTVHERKSAQERALREREKEYILPIAVERVNLPGLPSTISYLSVREGIPNICKMLVAKIM